MHRLLLLIPTRTYRAKDFLEAARRLDVEVVVGSDQEQVLAELTPGKTLALNFRDPEEATRAVVQFAQRYPIDTILSVDDDATVLAAKASAALSLPHNSVKSVEAARNKYRMREILAEAGLPSPHFELFSIDDDPEELARRVAFPCVLKPVSLAASRGVIRADDPASFVAAYRRVVAILRSPDVVESAGPEARQVLVEGFIPGREVALEGLLSRGRLQVLALFDKPDPLDGPYFEETIYVTPSRLPEQLQQSIAASAERTARALGLRHGPVHAELRVNDEGPWVVEVAARSIGGLCSRTLRFGAGISLEELILRHATGLDADSLERERRPAGVMMIPIPRAGILRQVRGQEEAEAVPGVEQVTLTISLGQEVVPLPEGGRYLGFIFARADTPEEVEAALREAHRRLTFTVTPE